MNTALEWVALIGMIVGGWLVLRGLGVLRRILGRIVSLGITVVVLMMCADLLDIMRTSQG